MLSTKAIPPMASTATINPIMTMMFQIEGSSTAITASIRNIVGKQSMMSTKRIITLSTQPP